MFVMERAEKMSSAAEMLNMSGQEYLKAVQKGELARSAVRVNPTDTDDQKLVEELEKRYRGSGNSLKNVSDLFEAAFIDLVHRLKLLGENTEIRYSPYDDFRNGVDAVIVIKDSQGRVTLAVGLDVTFSKLDIDKKLGHIKFEIEKGTLATIKYPGKGEKSVDHVPRCLIALDLRTVEQLIRLWLYEEENSVKTIRSHHAFRKILTEITEELRVFATESKSYQAKDGLSKARKYFEKLMAELPPSSEETEGNDRAFEALTFKLKNFKEVKTREPKHPVQ